MYSLVLMTALTSTPDAVEFNGFFRNLFSGGCSCSGASLSAGCTGFSAPRYSCSGGCAGSGYNTASCFGCSGSAYSAGCSGSGFGSRLRRWFSGWGSCTGSGYGCTGSGYSCFGSGYSCFGGAAYSCFGGPPVAYTPVVNGGLSCQGGMPLSAPPPVFGPNPAVPGAAPPPSIPYAPPEAAPGINPSTTGVRPASHDSALVSGGSGAARAAVIVRLPADARLFVDARQLTLTGAERKFVSPELPAGQEFMYRFRAEYDRDGETVSVTRKVPVRAGATVTVEFADLTARATPEKPTGAVAATPTSTKVDPPTVPSVAPASTPEPPLTATPPASPPLERATITVKLPPGATLYVDDRKSPSSAPVRQFSTPPLPAGREFAYLLRAEVVRNGQTETFTQKVPFRAGERVEVDFTSIGSR